MWKLIKKIYADLFGYFWKECPICKEMFGGYEIGDISLWEEVKFDKNNFPSFIKGQCVCKNCSQKAQEINYQKYHITLRST